MYKPNTPLKYISHKNPQKSPVIIPISSPYNKPYEKVIIKSKLGEQAKNGINGKIDVCIKNAKNIINTCIIALLNFPTLSLVIIFYTIRLKPCDYKYFCQIIKISNRNQISTLR